MRVHRRRWSVTTPSNPPSTTDREAVPDEQVEEALHILSPREAQILRMRFGLGAHRGPAPADIGPLWLRHLQARALRKLRASALAGS